MRDSAKWLSAPAIQGRVNGALRSKVFSMQAVEKIPFAASMDELELLLEALTRLRKGDSKARLPMHWTGLSGKVAEVFNDVVEQNAALASELVRLRKVVGREGKLR